MTTYGALLMDGGVLIAPPQGVYSFGIGDFSLETLVQATSPGTLISRKGTDGGAGNGGFLLAIEQGGVIKFATDDGMFFFQAETAPSGVLDGDWHHVAAVRQGGALTIYLDGSIIPSTTSGGGQSPLDVSNNLRLVLGGTDQAQEPANRLTGVLDDVALWSCALSGADIVNGMFERISPSAPNLVGYWPLNNSLNDESPTANSLQADGVVDFVAVYHWAALQYGANIAGTGVISAPANAAYDVGTGDFTVGGFVQTTQAGTLISRKGTPGGPGNGGFLLVLEPQGVIKFATDDGVSFVQAETAGTAVLDGSWHHVAAVRSQGSLSILLDGLSIPCTSSGSGTGSLNVDNSLRLVIGGTDQSQEPSNQFTGWLDAIAFWNVALAQSDLPPWLFNQLTGAEPGLVGFFNLDGNAKDQSPTGNNASCDPDVSFGVVYTALQTNGINSYSYCAITSDPSPSVLAARGLVSGAATTTQRQQSLRVQSGSPVLIAALNAPSETVEFPAGVSLTITDPNGQIYNGVSSTDTVHVALGDAGSIAQLVVPNPVAGIWTIVVEGPADARFQCQVTALPSQDVAATIEGALAPVYPEGQSSALSIGPRRSRLDGSWSCWWCVIGAWALAIIIAAIILVIAGVATGGVGFTAALAAVAAFLGAGGAVAGAFILSMGTIAVAYITQVLCVKIGKCGQSAPTLEAVVNNIRNKVGVPAGLGAMASRSDAGIDNSYPITLDVGGEGPKPWDGSPSFHGLVTGFATAINLNDKTQTTGGPPTRTIPLLVQVADWGKNPGYPLAAGFANYVTMQGSPLTDTNVTEMSRVIASGGKLGLWIDQSRFQANINQLAAALNSTAQYNAPDEFGGKAGFPKILIVNKR